MEHPWPPMLPPRGTAPPPPPWLRPPAALRPQRPHQTPRRATLTVRTCKRRWGPRSHTGEGLSPQELCSRRPVGNGAPSARPRVLTVGPNGTFQSPVGGGLRRLSLPRQTYMLTATSLCRHEDGINYNRILPDLIVGSCLQVREGKGPQSSGPYPWYQRARPPDPLRAMGAQGIGPLALAMRTGSVHELQRQSISVHHPIPQPTAPDAPMPSLPHHRRPLRTWTSWRTRRTCGRFSASRCFRG